MLNVTLEKPLVLIKGASDEVKAMYERLEPLKNGLVKLDMKDLYSQNPMLLRLVEEVRTCIQRQNDYATYSI